NFLLSSTLLGVLAQRLVRVICPACRKIIKPEEKLLRSMGVSPDEVADIDFFAGQGCEECRGTGFKGRTAIFEYLSVNDSIRKEIMARSSTEKIKDVAAENGMTVLRQDGWRKVREGITTIKEVLRVTLEK
ncbi:MAG: type II secretion system protein GspE, partial [Syntrophobacterales bacterium]|nr:type II secretion system protein GspE [Syntrophobacterales bacterium]